MLLGSLAWAANRIRQLEAQLEAARHDAERDEFLSIASHELKTPLTAIRLHTQIIKRNLDRDPNSVSPERVARMVDQTDRNMHKMTQLVDTMLDSSRIAAGKLVLHKEPTDLTALVREVVERLRPQLGPVTVDASGPVEGEWDRFRLEQVLTNLLSNADRYSEGKPIEVSVRRTGRWAEVAVRDQGIGIALDKQALIFERYQRAVSTYEGSGLGLGLFIVRSVVALRGGSVRVESAPERGATFTVALPCLPTKP